MRVMASPARIASAKTEPTTIPIIASAERVAADEEFDAEVPAPGVPAEYEVLTEVDMSMDVRLAPTSDLVAENVCHTIEGVESEESSGTDRSSLAERGGEDGR